MQKEYNLKIFNLIFLIIFFFILSYNEDVLYLIKFYFLFYIFTNK